MYLSAFNILPPCFLVLILLTTHLYRRIPHLSPLPFQSQSFAAFHRNIFILLFAFLLAQVRASQQPNQATKITIFLSSFLSEILFLTLCFVCHSYQWINCVWLIRSVLFLFSHLSLIWVLVAFTIIWWFMRMRNWCCLCAQWFCYEILVRFRFCMNVRIGVVDFCC